MNVTPEMLEIAISAAEKLANFVYGLVESSQAHTAEEKAAMIASIKQRLAAKNVEVAAVVIRDLDAPPS